MAFVVLGTVTTIEEARRGFDLAGNLERLPPSPFVDDPRAAQLGLLFDFVQFAVLVGAALWYRNRAAIHKRLMVIALLGPVSRTPVAHLIGSWVGPQQWAGFLFPISLALFLALLLLHDRWTEGRIHSVSLWASVLVFGSNFLFNSAVIGSGAWLAFSEWLLR